MCFSSSELLIWLNPEKSSMKDILSKLHVLSIIMSVMGNENSSLGHVALRSQKSMQTLIFLFFLSTGTRLPAQCRCYSSQMKPHSISLWTLISISSIMSGWNCRSCCLTGLVSGLMLRWCMATRGRDDAWPPKGRDQACLHSSMQRCLCILV